MDFHGFWKTEFEGNVVYSFDDLEGSEKLVVEFSCWPSGSYIFPIQEDEISNFEIVLLSFFIRIKGVRFLGVLEGGS